MNSFEKLKKKLAELFQLDQADLDFGIYRIMNARRDEIKKFLEKDLLPQVHEALGEYKSSDKAEIKKELDRVIEGVMAAGMDPEDSPKVQDLRARLSDDAVDIAALENEVFDHLYSFFSRYYDEGDFISLRRYKEGVYAIPYEGEEVKLYWANQDQYYVKTTEHFRDYTLKTPDGHRVHFKIIEADTEKDNIKSVNGKERRFVLHGEKPVSEEDGELFIRFEYCPDPDKRRQDSINQETSKRIFNYLKADSLMEWQHRLSARWIRSDGAETEKTILDKHLSDYTKRNTFDYFIHKDLGGFLRRELDFYIKNEVMRLDDIEEETAARVEQYLSKIKVIRRIAHKIIDFLAQIENFQKKLWLKKKFVIETNYCVTLDRVPEELYPEIAANDAQREEWVRLFAIDELTAEDAEKRGANRQEKLFSASSMVKYSEPLTVDFLKANPFLVLDTKFFGQDFKDKLLRGFDDIDKQCDGLLVHAENEQALKLISNKFNGQVECIFIDPPYNTGADGFPYKDNYQHSSWLTMIVERLRKAKPLMTKNGTFWSTIDDGEAHRLKLASSDVFGFENFIANVVWQKKYTRANDAKWFSDNHDHILVFAKNKQAVTLNLQPRSDQQQQAYSNPDNHPKGPWKATPLHAKSGSAQGFSYTFKNGIVWSPPPGTYPRFSKDTLTRLDNDDEIWFGADGSATPSRKTFLCDAKDGVTPITIWDYKEVGHNHEAINELKSLFPDNPFPNPKPTRLIRRIIQLASLPQESIVLDFFAGSGTTGHAVIIQNRTDGGIRKYLQVELGEHFDGVLIPRMKKAIHSKDWKDGKPVSREGISHMFKYIRLESYEDSLTNIKLQRTDKQKSLLDSVDGFRESYMLKYMLDTESKGSQTLLNIEHFDDPWNYKLLVGTGSVGETRPVNVDLVETFNWLLGLKVRHMERIRDFQVVEGENPKGEKVLVIWRKIRDLSETDPEEIIKQREKANRDLEAFFMKQQYNTLDSEFDIIFVNGDNNLMNIPVLPEKEGIEPRYKVRLIEEEFQKLMFDVKDI